MQAVEVPAFTSLILICPLCQVRKEVRKISLFQAPIWASLSCNSQTCHKRSTSRKWMCECNKLWHCCDVHAIIGHACGTDKRKANLLDERESKRPRFLKLPPPDRAKGSKECDLVPSRSSRKRQAPCELIQPITNPGPIMRARFPHIFPNSS